VERWSGEREVIDFAENDDQLLQHPMAQPCVGRVGGVDNHPLKIAGRQRTGLVRQRQALYGLGVLHGRRGAPTGVDATPDLLV
jgi:hypothetical protein